MIYIQITLIVLCLIAVVSYFTNPFVRFSLIQDLSKVDEIDNQLVLKKIRSVKLRYHLFWKHFSMLKSAWHIVGSRFGRRNRTRSSIVADIIKEIHEKRFDPKNMYLISGDHFSVLYPRSLGIFYHSILDPRTALNMDDWLNRQRIYLKTLAYALNVFSQSEELSTTIVPTTPNSVILLNIYATPSDTLYSLLYAFDQLLGSKSLEEIYPFKKSTPYKLATTETTQDMLHEYRAILRRHYYTYKATVFDTESGFIKKDILLSGTKDIVKKYGGFYDNVIFWKTTELAQKLGLIENDEAFLAVYKKRILAEYWREEGLFLEDMSDEARDGNWYSSDWLIAFQTGFLSVKNPKDRTYLNKAVSYIIENEIDQPFPIRYHNDFRKKRLHFPVNIGAPYYGSLVIWSHWGMEYIKLLIALSQYGKSEKYLTYAAKHLETYEFNISRYRGYPEVYNRFGDFYTSFFYRSVRTTGWIISYEQAYEMLKAYDK
ncbi:hypothetical protein IPM65_00255 [Candidatus Roizmanbacteria bacterium]|nr:MAG: hypothetical protein IPM65_00255 [Candidatus Roizmanbacteria bacterium]